MSDTLFKVGDEVLLKSTDKPKLTIHGFTKTGSMSEYDPSIERYREPLNIDKAVGLDLLRFVICTYYNTVTGSFQKVTLSIDEIKKA